MVAMLTEVEVCTATVVYLVNRRFQICAESVHSESVYTVTTRCL
jgi:hypothetical protein